MFINWIWKNQLFQMYTYAFKFFYVNHVDKKEQLWLFGIRCWTGRVN